MSEIDYEALAKAGHDCPEMKRFTGYSWAAMNGWDKAARIVQARAVVAALAGQELCVVRRDDIEALLDCTESLASMYDLRPVSRYDAMERVRAALAAPRPSGDDA